MPPRLICLALLVYWSIGVMALITRDVLPELSIASAPDFRSIAGAGKDEGQTRWSVQVLDDPVFPENLRAVGEAVTNSARDALGSVTMTSELKLDAKGLLKRTPWETKMDMKLEIASTTVIDPSGNLRSFHVGVRSAEDADDFLRVDGLVRNRTLEITTRGVVRELDRKLTFPYASRGLVQNALGPVDRLPGLHVGQRWETRVVSPFTGRTEAVRAEVTRRTIIHLGKNPITVFEVVHHFTPISARTWVRTDGLVLRQEVPFPFVKLILERQSDRFSFR
jgi:hypothetical protein